VAKKNVLLTGGSGFLGKNIMEQLGGKCAISAPGSRELDLTNAEAVESFLKQNHFDVVVHAASSVLFSSKAGKEGAEASLKMFQNVARCSRHFGKMIQIGSGAEYDKSRPLVRVREEEFGKRIPGDEYGLYKYECSKYIERTDNIVCLRLFGCFGKYEDYQTRFISNAICRSLFGLPITIANRNVVFSYMFIDDFVRIVGHFINHDFAHKFYNATPDETYDLLSIAQKIKATSGNGLPLIVKNSGMGPEYTGDNSRLKAEIPGFQFTRLDDGIKKLHSWYLENKSLLDKEKISIDRY